MLLVPSTLLWAVGMVATAWPRREGVLRVRPTNANLVLVASPWQRRMLLAGPLVLLGAAAFAATLPQGPSLVTVLIVAGIGTLGLFEALPPRPPASLTLTPRGITANAGKITLDMPWQDLQGVARGRHGRTLDFTHTTGTISLPATEFRSDPALIVRLITYLHTHPAERFHSDDELVRRAVEVN